MIALVDLKPDAVKELIGNLNGLPNREQRRYYLFRRSKNFREHPVSWRDINPLLEHKKPVVKFIKD